MNPRLLCSALCIAATAVGGCSTLGLGKAAESSMVVRSQPKGAGASVNIASFTLARDGYVVVHADANGRPGPVIGQTGLIEAGDYENVNVRIDASRAGTRVHPMLHIDDGDGVYEFPGADGPALTAGQPVVAPVDWL